MIKSASVVGGALTGLGLIALGLVSAPTQGNAGLATIEPADRIESAFDLLAASDLIAGPQSPEVRTVAIGYQTDLTTALLIRKPGLPTPSR